MVTDHKMSSTRRLPPLARGSALLAPMSGVTDVAFRRIAARFGAGLVVTEMVGSHSLVRGQAEAELRAEGAGLDPHVVQLVGREPATMAEAARIAEGAGASVIDLNFGCPAKRVTGGLAGSALMREPERALAIVATVVAAVRVPVTVKMRLGWDGASLNAAELAARAEEIGAQGVTVHGRTRQQFYDGRADWAAIAPVVAAVSVPVVANGDVVSLATARTCLAGSGAAAVMIGRAALGQPWLVGEVAAGLEGRAPPRPTPAEKAEAAAEHYEALLTLYGREVGRRHARKHLAAYADRATQAGYGLPPCQRRELVTSDDPNRVTSLLRSLYAEPARAAA
ncbi:MAG: tRNA dihydrouridine synthase DusB [Methylobacteriaceae bacterium]|nr:tRNA dihydrouridine synthase DusB [Methylobacteriaceae bacterium]